MGGGRRQPEKKKIKKISAAGNTKPSPPKTTAGDEARWEGSLPRRELSPSPPGACSCHPPVWQSAPVYPGWHKHAAVPFTAWHVPPFWHSLLSHGDSSAAGHRKKESGGRDQPRPRTGTWHPLHTVMLGPGRVQLGATNTPSGGRWQLRPQPRLFPKPFLGQLRPFIPLRLSDASALCWTFLPPSLPSLKVNSLLAFSTGLEAHWEPNTLAALPPAGGGQRWGKVATMAPNRDQESPRWLRKAQDQSITCESRASKTSV